MADFALIKSPKLISRKIWVASGKILQNPHLSEQKSLSYLVKAFKRKMIWLRCIIPTQKMAPTKKILLASSLVSLICDFSIQCTLVFLFILSTKNDFNVHKIDLANWRFLYQAWKFIENDFLKANVKDRIYFISHSVEISGFLSLIFYVKSILRILEAKKLPFFVILGLRIGVHHTKIEKKIGTFYFFNLYFVTWDKLKILKNFFFKTVLYRRCEFWILLPLVWANAQGKKIWKQLFSEKYFVFLED